MSIAQKYDLNPKYYNVKKGFRKLDSTLQQSSGSSNYSQKSARSFFFKDTVNLFHYLKPLDFEKRKNNCVHSFNFSHPVNYA